MKEKSVLKNVVFYCASCNSSFSTKWVSDKDDQKVRITNCKNCSPFYSKTPASEIKLGAVKKFNERVSKTQAIKDKKESKAS